MRCRVVAMATEAVLDPTLPISVADIEPQHAITDEPPYKLFSLIPNTPPVAFSPKTEVAIGRDKSACVLAFPESPHLSRVHCRIYTLGRDVFVHDHSSNGTFVNGKLMGKGCQRVLHDGDIIAALNPKQ